MIAAPACMLDLKLYIGLQDDDYHVSKCIPLYSLTQIITTLTNVGHSNLKCISRFTNLTNITNLNKKRKLL